jgi:hypothetical protein
MNSSNKTPYYMVNFLKKNNKLTMSYRTGHEFKKRLGIEYHGNNYSQADLLHDDNRDVLLLIYKQTMKKIDESNSHETEWEQVKEMQIDMNEFEDLY